MEHPYLVPEPRQLTERLRQQWARVQAQNRHLRRVSHRPDPAHVEQNVPLTRNTKPQMLAIIGRFDYIIKLNLRRYQVMYCRKCC
jgi:predicted trehalose synthase